MDREDIHLGQLVTVTSNDWTEVKIITHLYNVSADEIGIVIHITDMIGIAFPNLRGKLHSCSGRCKNHDGYYFHPAHIKFYSSFKVGDLVENSNGRKGTITECPTKVSYGLFKVDYGGEYLLERKEDLRIAQTDFITGSPCTESEFQDACAKVEEAYKDVYATSEKPIRMKVHAELERDFAFKINPDGTKRYKNVIGNWVSNFEEYIGKTAPSNITYKYYAALRSGLDRFQASWNSSRTWTFDVRLFTSNPLPSSEPIYDVPKPDGKKKGLSTDYKKTPIKDVKTSLDSMLENEESGLDIDSLIWRRKRKG